VYKETRTLERLSDTQRIGEGEQVSSCWLEDKMSSWKKIPLFFLEYLHFQTEKCFKKEARDFVALRTERQEVRSIGTHPPPHSLTPSPPSLTLTFSLRQTSLRL
jgi:hypothetical protein